MAGRRGVFIWRILLTTWKTRQKNPPIDWEVGEGGRYAFGLVSCVLEVRPARRTDASAPLSAGVASPPPLLAVGR